MKQGRASRGGSAGADQRERGQVFVESAIIMPLYVFLILGILQLMMAHQARLMVTYAAYKAVRAGSLNNADVREMEHAALAVLLPLLGDGPIQSGSQFATRYGTHVINRSTGNVALKIAEVTICGPTRDEIDAAGGGLGSKQELDFDDPSLLGVYAGVDAGKKTVWKRANVGRLRVQVTFNYELRIPYANMLIFYAAWGQQIAAYDLARMTGTPISPPSGFLRYALGTPDHYYIPVRANYSMRMMSNLWPSKLPQSNQCHIPFARKR